MDSTVLYLPAVNRQQIKVHSTLLPCIGVLVSLQTAKHPCTQAQEPGSQHFLTQDFRSGLSFQRMLVKVGSERWRDPPVISPSFAPWKAKPREAAAGQVNIHLAIKTLSPVHLGCRHSTPEGIGLQQLYLLPEVAAVSTQSRTRPRSPMGAGTAAGPRETQPASLSRAAQSSPERNLLSRSERLSFNSHSQHRSWGWEGAEVASRARTQPVRSLQ